MNEAFVKSNALFELGRRALEPTHEELDRTYEAVLSRAAALAAAGASTAADEEPVREMANAGGAVGGGMARFAALATKIGLAVLVLGLVASALFVHERRAALPVLARSDRSSLTRALDRAARPLSEARDQGPSAIDVRDLPVARPSATTPLAARGSGANPTDEPFLAQFEGKDVPASLAKELALMQKMAAAERAQRTADALLLVRQHEREFPNGVFREEREAIHALASCAKGDETTSRTALERFERGYPTASLLPRVRKACAR